MENLRFPNGIQLLPDEESVLVAETTMARIRRWLLHLFTSPSYVGLLKLQHLSLVWSLGDSGPSTFCLQNNNDAASLRNMSEILASVTMETSQRSFIRLMTLHVCARVLWLCGLVEVKKQTLIRSIMIKKWIFTHWTYHSRSTGSLFHLLVDNSAFLVSPMSWHSPFQTVAMRVLISAVEAVPAFPCFILIHLCQSPRCGPE